MCSLHTSQGTLTARMLPLYCLCECSACSSGAMPLAEPHLQREGHTCKVRVKGLGVIPQTRPWSLQAGDTFRSLLSAGAMPAPLT